MRGHKYVSEKSELWKLSLNYHVSDVTPSYLKRWCVLSSYYPAADHFHSTLAFNLFLYHCWC